MEIRLDEDTFPNHCIIHVIFSDKKMMNSTLGKLSYLRECNHKNENINYSGHNFPTEYFLEYSKKHALTEEETLLFKHLETIPYLKNTYMIGYVKGDMVTLNHELYHCKYYFYSDYRRYVKDLWEKIPTKKKDNITDRLNKMGYKQKFHMDEFQAYHFSEGELFWDMII